MSRHRGVDDQGRPVVAELGRAETPEEAAERKAASSALRRGSQTARNLIIALLASFGLVAFLVLVVVRPDAGPAREPVDHVAAAAAAEASLDEPLVAPVLPAGWYANQARLEAGASDGVVTWRLGIITDDDTYLSVLQGIDANASWVADAVAETAAGGEVTIGGLTWTTYDRRDVADPGNLAFALVTVSGASTVVIGGTASDADFERLADEVAAELGT